MSDKLEEIPLTTYFAVEQIRGQTDHDIAAEILCAGKRAGTLFRRLECIGTIQLGTRKLSRVRTDLKDPGPLLEKLKAKGHGVVVQSKAGGFEAHFGNRQGRVDGSLIMGYLSGHEPRPTKLYKGPKIKGWTEQFRSQ